MKLLTATALMLAIGAAPVHAQATGGAGSATAGGTASPGNAGAGVTTDYATGKSNATTPTARGQKSNAPGMMPSQNRQGTTSNQNGAVDYQQNGARGDTSGSNGAQPPNR